MSEMNTDQGDSYEPDIDSAPDEVSEESDARAPVEGLDSERSDDYERTQELPDGSSGGRFEED